MLAFVKDLLYDVLNFVDISTIVIALIALIVAIRTEMRANKEFKIGLELQKEVAYANIKPLVVVNTAEFISNRGIILSNAGVGPAVITFIQFSKNGKTTKFMPDLFDLPWDLLWDNYWEFGDHKHYLPEGKHRDLVRLTAESLSRNKKYSKKKIAEILTNMYEQMDGITIEVHYEDLMGNKQENYKRTIKTS